MKNEARAIKPFTPERRVARERPRADGRRLYDDPLRSLPGEYFRDGDVRVFMERASSWIVSYCQGRLSRDPDLVADFYLHFFERADSCLEKYRARTHMPFTGYLATYLRREFLNFKRRRSTPLQEYPAPEIFGELEASPLDEPGETDADLLLAGLPRIHELPPELRLPLKLYHGFALDSEELRTFVELQPSPLRASEFLREFHERRERMRAATVRRTHRAAHLSLLIHGADEAHDQKASDRRRRWKRSLEREQGIERYLYSMSELAAMLGVNKSSVSRRIRKAIEYLNRSTP